MRFINWESTAYKVLQQARAQRVPRERHDFFVKCVMKTLSRSEPYVRLVSAESVGPWFEKFVNKDIGEGRVGLFVEDGSAVAFAARLGHLADWARDLPDEQIRSLEGHKDFDSLFETSQSWYKAKKKSELLPRMNKGTTLVCQSKDGLAWYFLETEEAYKNEGDAMGHCVGGYHGRASQIFSLRDKENWPHLTVEVDKGRIIQQQARSRNERYHHHIPVLAKTVGFSTEEKPRTQYAFDPEVVEPAIPKTSPGTHEYRLAPTREERGPNGLWRNRARRVRNDGIPRLGVRGTYSFGMVADPQNAELHGKAFYMVPEVTDPMLLPKSINCKYISIGGPLVPEVLKRLEDRRSRLFLHIKDCDGVRIPKRKWAAIVLSNSQGVHLPKGYAGPLVLINATLARPYTPPRMDRIDQFVSWAASQGGNSIDCWYHRMYQAWRREEQKEITSAELPKYRVKP